MQASAVLGRRERKKRELRARIYEVARQLFLEQGFEATTVDEIARVADVSQATFFNYFPSKSAVLGEMTGEVFDRLADLVAEQLARPVPVQERIAGFAASVASEVAQARGLARDVVLELMRISAPRNDAAPYASRLREPFTAMLREGQGQGEVRRDLDASLLADMVIGTLNMVFTNWLNDPSFPLQRRLPETAGFIGDAIRPVALPRGAARGKRQT